MPSAERPARTRRTRPSDTAANARATCPNDARSAARRRVPPARSSTSVGIVLYFKASQITDKDNTNAVSAFANFLCGVSTILTTEPTAFITAEGTSISYTLENSSFSVMTRYINEVQKLIDNGINTDWEKKNYESYFNQFEDEWKMIRFD